jgi:Zinc carboxypeptidase
MRLHRLLTALIAAFMVLSLAPPSAAQPPGVPPDLDVPLGRWPEERGRSADAPGQQPAEPAPSTQLPGQPRNDVIEDVPVNPNDASIAIRVIPYHDIPPMLRELQQSDRISVEIIGESVLGRDLHLVVATSPMSDADWDEWQRLSDLRYDDPEAAIAAFEAGEYDGWKTPLLINNNIHGNEWEGTDASLDVLEELAFSTEADVLEILDRHVVAFVVTMNPDGRVLGQRGNANGFDMNRDFVTVSQPEVRAVRDQMVRYSPLTMLDMHGYVWSTLIEPTTGPHGDNYEYDLYIPKALRNGLAMEARVVSDVGDDLAAWADATGPGGTIPGNLTWPGQALIPYRDLDEGWDDWPPIFTPMYGMYHGSIGHTIEIPLARPNNDPRWTTELRDRRADINTRVGIAAIEANIDYATENQEDLLANQLEWFRRGVAGESARPIDDPLSLELACCENNEQANANTFLQEYPRAYVIPIGSGQRDDAAVARLVQFMIDNDVELHRAWRPFNLNGQNVGAGSYVVDMRQSKRGLANMLLEVGRDVTQEFNTMYDISAWSHGYLWGATVNRLAQGSLDARALRPVTTASPTGSVAPGNLRTYGLVATSIAGIQAVNFLLDNGVAVSRTADGTFAVPGSARSLVRQAAEQFGVAFTNLPPARSRDATPVSKLRVGVSAPFDEVFALTRMGFDLTSVTHTGFNTGAYRFGDFDAFFVSTTAFNPLNLDATQQAAFAQWLADGGTVVGRGGGGTTFNTRAGLLDVTFALGRGDANGIVAVENDVASPITSRSLPSSFVTAPRYFTSVGAGVRVDQRLEDGAFFLAGHWVGQEAAAGQAVVVSGQARGANVTLFGTEPLYRTHPEGLYEQVANALWWKG